MKHLEILIPHTHYDLVKAERGYIFFDKKTKLPLKAISENKFISFKYDNMGNIIGVVAILKQAGKLFWLKITVNGGKIKEYADSSGNWYDYRKFSEGPNQSIKWQVFYDVTYLISKAIYDKHDFRLNTLKPRKYERKFDEALEKIVETFGEQKESATV